MSEEIKSTKYTKVFGNNKWDVQIELSNGDLTWDIPGNVWQNLCLEFDLFDWAPKGYVTIVNQYDGLERFYQEGQDEPVYYFRMDGRDRLKIKIVDTEMNEDLPKEVWEINLDMVVYDTSDNKVLNNATKEKTIYFWDHRYHTMQEKNLEFSTAYKASQELNKPISKLKNHERAMYTGDALKELLTKAGFKDSIDTNVEKWDLGVNKIMYTSPATSTLGDDVKSILGSHLSKEGDRCIFYFNRGLGESGQWQLLPISYFFKNAGKDKPGELQIERFYFEDLGADEEVSAEHSPRHIAGERTLKQDLDLLEFNRITSYEFIDMSGIDNTKALVNKPVYWYYNKGKQFGLDYEHNEIKNVKEKFEKFYTDHLYAAGKPYSIFPLNQAKIQHHAVDPQFTWGGAKNNNSAISRSYNGSGAIMLGGLLLNECIHFRVLGSTHRHAGTFIAIERMNQNMDNHLDYKLCGQWFVVNVKHIMWMDKFVNDITAVKIHSYENLKISEAVE